MDLIDYLINNSVQTAQEWNIPYSVIAICHGSRVIFFKNINIKIDVNQVV